MPTARRTPRSGATTLVVGVSYATVGGGSATIDEDYLAAAGTLTFEAGQTTKTFSVPLVDNTLYEPSETVRPPLV